MRACLLVAATAVALANCAKPPPVVTPAMVATAQTQWADSTEAELQSGRATLVGKCSRCHRTPLPSERSPALWPTQVGSMHERAGLTEAERQAVVRYLIAAAQSR